MTYTVKKDLKWRNIMKKELNTILILYQSPSLLYFNSYYGNCTRIWNDLFHCYLAGLIWMVHEKPFSVITGELFQELFLLWNTICYIFVWLLNFVFDICMSYTHIWVCGLFQQSPRPFSIAQGTLVSSSGNDHCPSCQDKCISPLHLLSWHVCCPLAIQWPLVNLVCCSAVFMYIFILK